MDDTEQIHVWSRPSPDVADLPHSAPEYLADLDRRLRMAYLRGAEEDAVERLGRPMTATEQREVVSRYSGDTSEG